MTIDDFVVIDDMGGVTAELTDVEIVADVDRQWVDEGTEANPTHLTALLMAVSST